MSNWEFVQRLKKYGTASQAKRSRIRPLSQAFVSTKSSQATQTTKYEPPSPAPSRRTSRSLKAVNDWSHMRDAIDEDIVPKREPTSASTGTSSEQSTQSSASAGRASEGFSYLTPDTDIEMTQVEEPEMEPELPSAPILEWNLPSNFTILSYSRHHQTKFDNLGLSWGVQWEIARIAKLPGVGWDSIPLDSLEQLCGPSAEQAPRVLSVLLRDHPNYRALNAHDKTIRPPNFATPWEEYDKEEESIRDGSTARLGGDGGYFGGKIDQIARLEIEKDEFKFTLLPPKKDKSFRFRRFMGSRRLLDVRFSEQVGRRSGDIIKFFARQALVINGRIFRAFYAQKTTVHLVETNETALRPADPLFGDDHRLSLNEFIEWHNPLYANPNQPIPKWVSRFALGFSDSQPGISFAPANIHRIDDIVAPGQTGNSAIMTDGAGYINLSALYRLTAIMKWPSVPVCVQARFGSSKGLFILHPTDRNRDADPQIYIRPSQIKVKLHPDPSRWCPSHRVLDVLIRAPISTGIQITDQVIMNLAHNGVSTETLDALTQNHIRSVDFIPLMQEDHLTQLWDTVYNHGHVQDYKLKGLTPAALARAHGLANIQDEDDRHRLSSARFTYENDPFSGAPPNYETQALGLLQAGFTPSFPPLFNRLESIHKQLLFGLDEKCHLRIPDSALAFVIPDPLGVLEPGEVFCGFRNPVHDTYSGQEKYCITGPVLVTRNPCILPSDVRKVMAVDCGDLWTAGYHDVIVFPVKGESSQASMLGGGDYDGDTVIMIWDRAIVDQFTNSDTHYPNVDVSDCFDLRRGVVKDIAPNDHESVLGALLAPLAPTQVGMYGNWHMNAAKLCGLDHPETVRLGNVFTTCLDGQKTGLTLHKHVLGADSARWNSLDDRLPRKFTVIEELKDALDQHRKKCEIAMNERKPPLRHDPDLLAPYKKELELCEQVPGLREELGVITAFVDLMRTEHREGEFSVFKRHGAPRFDRVFAGGKKTNGNGKTHSPGERQESEHAASEAYNRGMPKKFIHIRDYLVPRIAASYAYSTDNRGEPKFSFAVAWDELCKIKAEAQGRTLSMVPRVGEALSVSRRMRQQMDLIYDFDNA
ncbi:hypothetical protein FRC10_005817 [Ceratobasidium sp. 414]|nr:hypothetical protein FRC10_005817 [Ceratobasidium sp. 414]